MQPDIGAICSIAELEIIIINGRNKLSLVKILAIILIIAGLSGLVYGRFSYTRETQEAKIGPLELSVKNTETFYVPAWLGVGAVVVGGGLLLFASRKS
jgi:hypothetical protein